VDICRSGYPFKAEVTVRALEPEVQAWLHWLDAVVCDASWPSTSNGVLPDALTHLSADGAFRLVEALGLCPVPGTSVRAALAKCATPPALGGVIARGVERMRAIEAAPPDAPRFAPVVNQVALLNLSKDFAKPQDQSLALWLLHSMRSDVDPGPTRAGARPKGQLPLFIV
jgi:hypothetical protein